MSSVIEELNAGLNDARDSLRRAEEIIDAYMQGTVIFPAEVTYQDLKDNVIACTARVERSQKTLQHFLDALNRGKLVV